MSERLLEAIGPIVVKEVRQGLRARVFGICFGLLLAACLIVSLIAASEVQEWELQTLGPRYLSLFLAGLSLVLYFVIPYTAYRSMAREREDETWVLLALTGLSSRRIVRGKVASALTQALLYASAGAPFMVFSYFLNGVDLPTLLLEVFFAACWAVFVTCVAVALGTEGHSRLGRAAVHFLVLGLLGGATVGAIAFGSTMAREGSEWVSDNEFQIFAAAFPAGLLTTALLILEGAAAGLSLASDATVKGARLVLLGQLVTSISVTYLATSLAATHNDELAPVASVLTTLLLVTFGFFAISEQDGFPRSAAARTWLTAGALRGWKLTMVALLLTSMAWLGLHLLIKAPRTEYALIAAPLYAGLYLSLAVCVGRQSPMRTFGEPAATRLSFLGLVILSAVLSPVAAVIAGERANSRGWNALNPIFGMDNFLEHRLSRRQAEPVLIGLFVLCLLAAAAAWAVLKRRDRPRIS